MDSGELTNDFRRFSIIYHDVRKAIKNPVALALYVILVEYSDGNTRQAFPSRPELASQLGFKKAASVDKYLDILQDVGVVTVVPRYKNKDGVRSMEQTEEFSIRTSNLYIVHDRPRISRENGGGWSANGDGGSPQTGTGGSPQMGTGGSPSKRTVTIPTKNYTHKELYNPLSSPSGGQPPKGGGKGKRQPYPDAFEQWWRTYPRRKNASKKAAHTQWAKAVKEIDHQRLLELTAAYARNPGVSDERYIPHPQKWLRDQRWESIDEAETPTPQPKPSGIAAWLGYDPNAPQPTDGVIDAEIIDTKELPSWTG